MKLEMLLINFSALNKNNIRGINILEIQNAYEQTHICVVYS